MRISTKAFRLSLTCISLLYGAVTSSAQDVLERVEVPGIVGPKVYTNVRFLSQTGSGIKVAHDGGIAVLPLASIPEAWRARLMPSKPEVEAAAPEAPASIAKTPSRTVPGGSSAHFAPESLVTITTDSGTGSGFIVTVDGLPYVYTNAHVICGGPGSFSSKIVSIVTTHGTKLQVPEELELSDELNASLPQGLEDLARFRIRPEDAHQAYTLADAVVVPKMGEKVVAFGNSLGAGVFTELEGSVVGLGTDRIEIDCEIVPGNSGGPVVSVTSKRVLGISTYLTKGRRDIWTKDTKFSEVRRFAVRPEKVSKWRKLKLTSLMSALAELSAFERDTLSLAAACYLNPRSNRGGFDAPSTQKGDYIVKNVIVSGSSHRLGGIIASSIQKVNQRLGAATATISMAEVVPVFAAFFNTVATESAAQIKALQAADRAAFLKRQIPLIIEDRLEVHADFVKQADRFR